MRDDLHDYVIVTHDVKVKSPVAVNSCLLQIARPAVFLHSKAWLPHIHQQKVNLLQEGLLHRFRSIRERPRRCVRVLDTLLQGFGLVRGLRATSRMDFASAALAENGPWTRPFLRSSRPSAKSASMALLC